MIKTSCQWRQLPNDFPPYTTVSSFYHRACKSGLWDKILQHVVKRTREEACRSENPSYALIDSQSVKNAAWVKETGFDGGKKVKGRKRHIVTDAMGNLLAIEVHAANINDTISGFYPALQAVCNYPRIASYDAYHCCECFRP